MRRGAAPRKVEPPSRLARLSGRNRMALSYASRKQFTGMALRLGRTGNSIGKTRRAILDADFALVRLPHARQMPGLKLA
jgi:hypothetical protein